MKSPKPRNKAQIKVDCKNYDAISMSRNYDRKLSASILRRGKCGNYRETGVSKNRFKVVFLTIMIYLQQNEVLLITILFLYLILFQL